MEADYEGGLLAPLKNIFLTALKDCDEVKAVVLCDRWNEEIRYINQVLSQWRSCV